MGQYTVCSWHMFRRTARKRAAQLSAQAATNGVTKYVYRVREAPRGPFGWQVIRTPNVAGGWSPSYEPPKGGITHFHT